jgi:hypothetical protein
VRRVDPALHHVRHLSRDKDILFFRDQTGGLLIRLETSDLLFRGIARPRSTFGFSASQYLTRRTVYGCCPNNGCTVHFKSYFRLQPV